MDDDTLSELNLTVRIKIPGSVPEKAQKDSKAKQGKGKDPSAEKFGVCPGYAVNAIHKRNEGMNWLPHGISWDWSILQGAYSSDDGF